MLEGMPKIQSKVDRCAEVLVVRSDDVCKVLRVFHNGSILGWCMAARRHVLVCWDLFGHLLMLSDVEHLLVSSDRRGRPLVSWLSGSRARWYW
jgi:hypothetical protein